MNFIFLFYSYHSMDFIFASKRFYSPMSINQISNVLSALVSLNTIDYGLNYLCQTHTNMEIIKFVIYVMHFQLSRTLLF